MKDKVCAVRVRGRRKRGKILLFLLLPGFVLTALLFIKAIQTPLVDIASTYASNTAVTLINDAVAKACGRSELNAVSIMERDSKISAVELDTAKINKFKTEITANIRSGIENTSETTVYIPLGAISQNKLFAASGVKIPVKIMPLSIMKADFSDSFTSAGINQVRHSIDLQLAVNMAFVGFGVRSIRTVATTVPVSETIIVGDVPSYYSTGSTDAAIPIE